jgi:SSS family solute:Na+ symporter
MSIAAANLFTRNVWVDFVNPNATPQQQTQVAQAVSLVVKFGALAFVLGLDATSAINFQLLGGVLILQTFPAIVFGLYTRYFHRWALLLGWAAGIGYGAVVAWNQSSATQHHFASQVAQIPWTHQKAYIAVSALVVNLVVLIVANAVLRAVRAPAGVDQTTASDYEHEDEGEGDMPEITPPAPAGTPTPPRSSSRSTAARTACRAPNCSARSSTRLPARPGATSARGTGRRSSGCSAYESRRADAAWAKRWSKRA